MNAIEGAGRGTAPGAAPRNGEYLGGDGLLRCARCHGARQIRLSIMGRESVAPCLCQCGIRERDERERRRREEDEMWTVRRLRASGIQDRHLAEWTFDRAEDTRQVQMAKRYVENWESAKRESMGLLLWGDVGTGKSFLAACIANALIERGVPALMTSFSKILNQMGGIYSDERRQYVDSLSRFPLLVADDFGAERGTEYALEQVYSIVDERYKSGLPLIVTTNLTIGEIRDPQDVGRARIFSRLLEMCVPVQVTGADRREAEGRRKQGMAREALLP